VLPILHTFVSGSSLIVPLQVIVLHYSRRHYQSNLRLLAQDTSQEARRRPVMSLCFMWNGSPRQLESGVSPRTMLISFSNFFSIKKKEGRVELLLSSGGRRSSTNGVVWKKKKNPRFLFHVLCNMDDTAAP